MLEQLSGLSQPIDYRLVDKERLRPSPFPNLWNAVSLLLLVAAVILWAISLPEIDLRPMDDLGLISVLPASVLVALLLLNLGFCIAVSLQKVNLPLLLLHI